MPACPTRFLDQGKSFFSFINCVDVVCPKCHGAALMKWAGETESYRFACENCGASKEIATSIHIGCMQTVEPVRWLGYVLLRQTRCRNHVLWALNMEHADYLRSYLSATHRERVMERPQMVGRLERLLRVRNGFHVVSRLPRWLVIKSSRPHALRALSRISGPAFKLELSRRS